jgi:Ca2+/Na+ antiporter
VPENIAGVTVTALGNGAADIFRYFMRTLKVSTFAAFNKNEPRLAFGELIGASVWVSLITVSIICISYPSRLPKFVVQRDISFFLVTLIFCLAFLIEGKIHLWQAVTMLCLYFVYVAFAIIMSLSKRNRLSRASPSLRLLIPAGPSDASLSDASETGSIRAGDFPSAAPSVESLSEDPEFDEDYYQPTLHFRHSFPNREMLHRKASQVSWHRRSFIDLNQAAGEIEPSLSEDALDFQNIVEGAKNVFYLEFKQSLPFLFPILLSWSQMRGRERVWACIQTPLLFIFTIAAPLVEKEFLQNLRQDGKEYEPLPDVDVEPQDPPASLSRVYPRLLLCLQLFCMPIVSVFLLHGILYCNTSLECRYLECDSSMGTLPTNWCIVIRNWLSVN